MWPRLCSMFRQILDIESLSVKWFLHSSFVEQISLVSDCQCTHVHAFECQYIALVVGIRVGYQVYVLALMDLEFILGATLFI